MQVDFTGSSTLARCKGELKSAKLLSSFYNASLQICMKLKKVFGVGRLPPADTETPRFIDTVVSRKLVIFARLCCTIISLGTAFSSLLVIIGNHYLSRRSEGTQRWSLLAFFFRFFSINLCSFPSLRNSSYLSSRAISFLTDCFKKNGFLPALTLTQFTSFPNNNYSKITFSFSLALISDNRFSTS